MSAEIYGDDDQRIRKRGKESVRRTSFACTDVVESPSGEGPSFFFLMGYFPVGFTKDFISPVTYGLCKSRLK